MNRKTRPWPFYMHKSPWDAFSDHITCQCSVKTCSSVSEEHVLLHHDALSLQSLHTVIVDCSKQITAQQQLHGAQQQTCIQSKLWSIWWGSWNCIHAVITLQTETEFLLILIIRAGVESKDRDGCKKEKCLKGGPASVPVTASTSHNGDQPTSQWRAAMAHVIKDSN